VIVFFKCLCSIRFFKVLYLIRLLTENPGYQKVEPMKSVAMLNRIFLRPGYLHLFKKIMLISSIHNLDDGIFSGHSIALAVPVAMAVLAARNSNR
jgi:hypothetical protein